MASFSKRQKVLTQMYLTLSHGKRATSPRSRTEILNYALSMIRIAVIAIALVIGIFGIYHHQVNSSWTDVISCLLSGTSEVIQYVNRLRDKTAERH